MTVAKFRERCHEMNNYRGYKVHDVTVYLNQLAEVQVAAVWHCAVRSIKIHKPLEW
jgi:hypothetical protein